MPKHGMITERLQKSWVTEDASRDPYGPALRRLWSWLGAFVMILFALGGSLTAAQAPDWPRFGDEGIEWLRQHLTIDTTNPPGNEIRGAEFFARMPHDEGIPYLLMESSGRGILYAELPGDGSHKGLVLLRGLARPDGRHGSVSNPDSAVTHILGALQRIQAHQPPVILTPLVEGCFKALAASETGPTKQPYENIQGSIKNPVLKVLFGSDAFFYSREVNVPATHWLAVQTVQTAVAAGLAEMVSTGEMTEARALEIARDYFNDNSTRLFGTPPLSIQR